MKNSLQKIGLILALASAGTVAMATSADKNGYWLDSNKEIVRSGTGLCWHTGSWTPADAIDGCDGVVVKAKDAPVTQPAEVTVTPTAKSAAPIVVAPKAQQITFAADAFFDFDKAVLKPEGKAKLEDLVSKLQGADVKILITGHTDATGPDAYNMKLSLRRAEACKDFLISKGISATRVTTEGKAGHAPVADNRTREGRAKNRRVEFEVTGTRAAK